MLCEEPTIHGKTLAMSLSQSVVLIGQSLSLHGPTKKLAMRQGAYLRVIPGNSNQEVRRKVGREDSHTEHACELYFTLQLGLSLTVVL